MDKNVLSKIFTSTLVFAFVFNGTVSFEREWIFAAPLMQNNSQVDLQQNLSLVEKIKTLVSPTAQVERVNVRENEDPILFLIRDLHCQEEAQSNIAKTIERLRKELEVQNIFIEGAHGPFDMDLAVAFPERDVRERVARRFMKEGYLTGAEYATLSLGLENSLKLYGIEDPRTYIENLKTFRAVRRLFHSSQDVINAFEQSLQEFKKLIYSKELKNWSDYRESLHATKTLKFEQMMSDIEGYLKKKNRVMEDDLKEWMDIGKASALLDTDQLSVEREHLLNFLRRKLVKEELRELIKLNLEYRIGRINSKEYLEGLKVYFEKTNRSFSSVYSGLDQWLQLEIRREAFNSEDIWNKLDQLLASFMKDEVEGLGINKEFQLLEEWNLIKSLIQLKLTKKEIPWMMKFNRDSFSNRLSATRIRFNLSSQSFEVGKIEALVHEAKSFYELALKRDQILVAKALQSLQSTDHRQQTTDRRYGVLITGGFHTSGIEEILEKQGISYVTLTPKVKKLESEEIYERLMNIEEYDFANVEFSEKRLALRLRQEKGKWTLATPALFGSILEAIAKGNYEGELKRFFTEMLGQEEVRLQRLNELLNNWMQEGKNREFLDSLNPGEMKSLLDAVTEVYPDEISAQIAKLDAESFTQREIALGAFRISYGEAYSGLLAMIEIYFKKTSDGGPFESVDAALDAYRARYGEPDPEIWSLIQGELPDYEWWVKSFGIKDLLELGKAVDRHARALFSGLPAVKELIKDEASLKRVGQELVELRKAAGRNASDLFEFGLPAVKELFGDQLQEYWPELVELAKTTGIIALRLFEDHLPQAKKVWDGNLDEMIQTINRLYQKILKEHQSEVYRKFAEIIKWSKDHPGQEDLIRERLTQIANRNFVNNTPQFVLPELEKFLEELQGARAVPEGDEYALATGGYIAQGELAIAEFHRQLASPQPVVHSTQFEEEFRDVLDGHEVYVLPAVVKGKDDFVLGYRDIENKRVYISQEVLNVLQRSPPEERNRLLKEYLYHEAHENPADDKDHYSLIEQQQKLFHENYEGRGYRTNSEGVLEYPVLSKFWNFIYALAPSFVLWMKRPEFKVAKGALGECLSSVINGVIRNRGRFVSVEEALKAYREIYGEPDVLSWQFIQEKLPRYEEWVKQFGLRDLIELAKSGSLLTGTLGSFGMLLESLSVLKKSFGTELKDYWPDFVELGKSARLNAWALFRRGLPELNNMFGSKLKDYWPDLMKLGKAAGEDVDQLFPYGLMTVQDLFSDRFEQYWPDLVELGKAAGKDVAGVFAYGLPAVKGLIVDRASLRRIGNDLLEFGRAAGENSKALFQLFLPEAIKELIVDEASFNKVGNELLQLVQAVGENAALLGNSVHSVRSVFNMEEFRQYWPTFVDLGKAARGHAPAMFKIFPLAMSMWNDNHDNLLLTIQRLYQKGAPEDQTKILGTFVEIVEWSTENAGKEDLIRERLTQIANRNFVNNTPQFVLPELKKFLAELEVAKAIPSGTEDEYAMAVVQTPDAPSDKSSGFSQSLGISTVLGQRPSTKPVGGIIVPSAVPINQINVNGPFNSVEEALEAYRSLYGEPDPEIQKWIQENLSDYETWVKRFGIGVFIKLYAIDKKAALSVFKYGLNSVSYMGLINSFEDVLEKGKDLIRLRKGVGRQMGDRVLSNGLKRLGDTFETDVNRYWSYLIQMGIDVGENALELYENGFPLVKEMIKDDKSLQKIGKDLVDLIKASGMSAVYQNSEIYQKGLPELKQLWGPKFEEYWPVLVEIGKAAGLNSPSIFQYGLTIFRNQISDEQSLKEIGMELVHLGNIVGSEFAAGFFSEALPKLREIFIGEFYEYWPSFVQITNKAPRLAVGLFHYAMPALRHLIKDQETLVRVADELIRLGNGAGDNSGILYSYAFAALRDAIRDEDTLKRIGNDLLSLIQIMQKNKLDVRNFFMFGLPSAKAALRESFHQYWPMLIELAKIADENAAELFSVLRKVENMWLGNLEAVFDVLGRLHAKIPTSKASVLGAFAEIINWSEIYLGQEELIRERITQIANRNFVNNTPQFVLPELEQFLAELKTAEQSFRAAQAVPEGDEYARSRAQEGYIAQGTEAIAEFHRQLASPQFAVHSPQLEKEHADILDGHEVYVFPAIVKGPDDFVLGYRDIKKKRIYVAEEVILVLRREPDLLREYLWHEAHEDPANDKDHETLIAQQQEDFKTNYQDPNYVLSPEGYLIDPDTQKIAKGLLGKRLRHLVINGLVLMKGSSKAFKDAVSFLYFQDALKAYQAVYGDPTENEHWRRVSHYFDTQESAREVVIKFGLKDVMDLIELVADEPDYLDDEGHILFGKKGFHALTQAFGEDLDKYWRGFVEMAKSRVKSYDVDYLIDDVLNARKAFGDKLEKYWPGIVELVIANQNIRRIMPLIFLMQAYPEEMLDRYWSDILQFGKSVGREAGPLCRVLIHAKEVWGGDIDQNIETLKRLYEKVDTGAKSIVLYGFIEIMQWSEENPGQEELIRERLTQIANRNFVNNTPHYVLPELVKFLKELKEVTRGGPDEGKEDEYALVKGDISQERGEFVIRGVLLPQNLNQPLADRLAGVPKASQQEEIKKIIDEFVRDEKEAKLAEDDIRNFLKVYGDATSLQKKLSALTKNEKGMKRKIKSLRIRHQWKDQWSGSVLLLQQILQNLNGKEIHLKILSEEEMRKFVVGLEKTPRYKDSDFPLIAFAKDQTIYVNEEASLADLWMYMAHEVAHIFGGNERTARKIDAQLIANLKGVVSILRNHLHLKDKRMHEAISLISESIELQALDYELDIHTAHLQLTGEGRAFLKRYQLKHLGFTERDESYVRAVASSAAGVIRPRIDPDFLISMKDFAERMNQIDFSELLKLSPGAIKEKLPAFRKFKDEEIKGLSFEEFSRILSRDLQSQASIRVFLFIFKKTKDLIVRAIPAKALRDEVISPLNDLAKSIPEAVALASKKRAQVKKIVKEILREENPVYQRINHAFELDLLLMDEAMEKYALDLLKPLMDQEPIATIQILGELRNRYSVEFLMDYLTHSDEKIVRFVTQTFYRWGNQDAPPSLFEVKGLKEKFLDLLRKYLNKQDQKLSEIQSKLLSEAAWFVGQLRLSEAVQPLARLIRKWNDEDVAENAAGALAKIADKVPAHIIIRELSDSSPRKRRWTLLTLSRINSADALGKILKILQNPASLKEKVLAYQALESLVRRGDYPSYLFDSFIPVLLSDLLDSKLLGKLRRYEKGIKLDFIFGRIIESFWGDYDLQKLEDLLQKGELYSNFTRLKKDSSGVSNFVEGLVHGGNMKINDFKKISQDGQSGLSKIFQRILRDHLGPWLKEIRYVERLEKDLYEGKKEYSDDVWLGLGRRLMRLEKSEESLQAGKVWYQRNVLKLVYRSLLDQWGIGDYERRQHLLDEMLKKSFFTDPQKGDDPSWSYVDFEEDVMGIHQDFFASRAGLALGVSTAWHEALHYVRNKHQDLIKEVDEISLLGAASIDAVELKFMLQLLGGPKLNEILKDIQKDVPVERIAKEITEHFQDKIPKSLKGYSSKILEILRGMKLRLEKDSPMKAFAEIRKLSVDEMRDQSWFEILRHLRKTWEEEELVTTLRGEKIMRVDTYRQGPVLSGFALGLAHELDWSEAFALYHGLLMREHIHPAQAEFIVRTVANLMKAANDRFFSEIENQFLKSDEVYPSGEIRKWIKRIYFDYFKERILEIIRSDRPDIRESVDLWTSFRKIIEGVDKLVPELQKEVENPKVNQYLRKRIQHSLELETRIFKAVRTGVESEEGLKDFEYIFPDNMTQRIRILEKNMKSLRTGSSDDKENAVALGNLTLQIPTAGEELPMLLVLVEGSTTKTKLLMMKEMVEIFNFHGIQQLKVDKESEINLLPIVAHLGALKERNILLGENEGFDYGRDIVLKKGNELIVSKEGKASLIKSWRIGFLEETLTSSERSLMDIITLVKKDINQGNLVNAKLQLLSIKDEIKAKYFKKNNEVKKAFYAVMDELQKAFEAKLVEMNRLKDLKMYPESVKILIELYDGFQDEPIYRSSLEGLEEHFPVLFALQVNMDRAKVRLTGKTLRSILKDLGFESPRQFLEFSVEKGILEEAQAYLKKLIVQNYSENFGRIESVITELGYSTSPGAFYEMIKNLQIDFDQIDFSPLERLKEKVDEAKKKHEDHILLRAVKELGFKNFSSFAEKFGEREGFQSYFKQAIEDAFALKGKYKPFVYDYLGVSRSYLDRKIREYQIDISKIEDREGERLKKKLGLEVSQETFNLKKVIEEGMGYPTVSVFRSTYKGVSSVEKVLKEFFQTVLQRQGGNIIYCASLMGIGDDMLRHWLRELKVEQSELQYDEGKRLRDALEQLRREELQEKGALHKIETIKVERFNLAKATSILGWKDFQKFSEKHGKNENVRKVLKETFAEVLKLTHRQKKLAARLLGIDYMTFLKWIEILEIPLGRGKSMGEQNILEKVLRQLPAGQRERLDLATASLGFGQGDPESSIRSFMERYGNSPEVRIFLMEMITRVLIEQGGFRPAVEKRLGISKVTLTRYIQELGIDVHQLPYDELHRLKEACKPFEIPNLSRIIEELGYTNLKTFMEHNKGDAALVKYIDQWVEQALSKKGGNITQTAQTLGVSVFFVSSVIKRVKNQEADPISIGSFAINPDTRVSGALGIDNQEVGKQIAELLDPIGIETRTGVQIKGSTVSFSVDESKYIAESEKSALELAEVLTNYMSHETYTVLDSETRSEFETVRLVALGDRAYVARNEKGTSYAHLGYGGKKDIPTLYIGRDLLESLLQNDPKALSTLLKIEMNRKIYRNTHKEGDSRTSQEVVKEAQVTPLELEDLKKAIAKAEAQNLLKKIEVHQLAEAIVKAAKRIDEDGEKVAVIDGIVIGQLRGHLLVAVVEELSHRINEIESRAEVKKSARAIQEKREERGIQKLANVLRESFDENSEGVLINTFGDIKFYQGIGIEAKEIELDSDSVQLISQMIGKRSGDIEKIFIDLKRGDINLEKVFTDLIAGEPVEKDQPLQIDSSVIERMEIEDDELIHVSTGNRSIQDLREKAEVYDKARSYFILDHKKKIPIGVEVELLEGINEDESKAFIERRQTDVALIGEEKKVASILALFPEYQERLRLNRLIYDRLEEDHKMLVLRDDSKLKAEGAGLLRVKKDSLGLQTQHVIDLASFIASVGKKQAKTDPRANELLRQVLRTLYDSGEIPQELLSPKGQVSDEMPLAKILDNPEGFLFPPIKTQDAVDIDSYLRAKRAIESMA